MPWDGKIEDLASSSFNVTRQFPGIAEDFFASLAVHFVMSPIEVFPVLVG